MLKRYLRILSIALLTASLVGPLSMGTTYAQALVAQGATQASGTIAGSIKDVSGAPIAGATVRISGPQTQAATTDAQGNFSIANLPAGIYAFEARKSGYNTATESSITVLAGSTQTLAVTMSALSFTTLRTIANVRSSGRGTFNTTPASVNVVSSQTFSDRGQQQVMQVLDGVPGVQMSISGNGVNGAAPGGISFANVRGGRSYETATLIDGHPLFVGDYGDYVSTFLNSFMFKDVEIVKGPGATVPQVNFALGGTVNFETKDPTYVPTADFMFGTGSYGGTFENMGFSNTFGRLGIVVDYANNNAASAFNNQRFYFSNFPGFNYTGANGTSVLYGATSNPQVVPATAGAPVYSKASQNLAEVACCLPVNGNLNAVSELVKATYKLSGATSLSASYLGGQARADQFANTGDVQYYTFEPLTSGAPAYTGSLKPGTVIPVVFGYASQEDYETNNEPMVQAELRTTLGKDSILARYYHASIVRLQYQGPNDPTQPEGGIYNVWGNQSAYQSTQKAYAFNGGPYQVANYEYYRATEQDMLSGYSFQYLHPIGDDLLTLAVDTNDGSSVSYSQSGASRAGAAVPLPSVSIPKGSGQILTTYMLRGEHHFNSKLQGTLSLYNNRYKTTTNNAPQGGATGCQFDGTNCQFTTENSGHFDGRLGFEWRPSYNWAVRASAGSSIVPPYLGLLTAQTTGLPFNTTPNDMYKTLGSYKNPNLLPETAFGYDLGFDHRFGGQTTLVFDTYMTNMFNGYFQELTPTGFTCATPGYCTGSQAGNAAVPIYAAYNANLSNARFEGIEAELRHTPQAGFGWDLAGSTQRGYAYNLPPCFYSNVFIAGTNKLDCTKYTTNLNVVAGQNFSGGANFMGVTNGTSARLTGGTGISAQNQNIPYFNGNVALNYTFKNGVFAEVGDTLFGKNNSYNLPPFGIGYASLRFPVNNGLAIQFSGNNIFNAYTGLFPVAGAGVPVNLVNGGLGATNANVVGPATYQIILFFHKAGSNP